jgi:protein-tyrosine phosphatase
MVCSGNICRSPMAEVVLRARLVEARLTDVSVDSFGTGPWHQGQPADARAAATLDAAGYPVAHTARMITAADVAGRDLLVAMDGGHRRHLQQLAEQVAHPGDIRLLSSFARPWPGADEDVPDPYYGDVADYEHVLALVEAGAAGIVAELRAGTLT